MLISYNWLKDYLGEDLPSVDKVVDLLTTHSFEVESIEEVLEDVVIDIKVLPEGFTVPWSTLTSIPRV